MSGKNRVFFLLKPFTVLYQKRTVC